MTPTLAASARSDAGCRQRNQAHPRERRGAGVPSPAGHANGDRTRRTAEHDQACNRPSLAKDESVPHRQIIRELKDMRDYLDRASRSFGMKPTAERNKPVDHLFQFSQRSALSRCRPRWPVFRLTKGCAAPCRRSPARPGGRARAGRPQRGRALIFDQFDPTRLNRMHQGNAAICMVQKFLSALLYRGIAGQDNVLATV
jgi:hypothetical protein